MHLRQTAHEASGAELLDDVGIDMSVAQKNIERLGLIVRQMARVLAVPGK